MGVVYFRTYAKKIIEIQIGSLEVCLRINSVKSNQIKNKLTYQKKLKKSETHDIAKSANITYR